MTISRNPYKPLTSPGYVGFTKINTSPIPTLSTGWDYTVTDTHLVVSDTNYPYSSGIHTAYNLDDASVDSGAYNTTYNMFNLQSNGPLLVGMADTGGVRAIALDRGGNATLSGLGHSFQYPTIHGEYMYYIRSTYQLWRKNLTTGADTNTNISVSNPSLQAQPSKHPNKIYSLEGTNFILLIDSADAYDRIRAVNVSTLAVVNLLYNTTVKVGAQNITAAYDEETNWLYVARLYSGGRITKYDLNNNWSSSTYSEPKSAYPALPNDYTKMVGFGLQTYNGCLFINVDCYDITSPYGPYLSYTKIVYNGGQYQGYVNDWVDETPNFHYKALRNGYWAANVDFPSDELNLYKIDVNKPL